MVGSLNDNSTETFWESCDEDRNKSKWVTASLNGAGGAGGAAGGPGGLKPQENGAKIRIKSISVHIDNGRDIGNKVSHLIFKGSRNSDSISEAGNGNAASNAAASASGSASNDLVTLKTFDVDSRFAGWVTCFIDKVRTLFKVNSVQEACAKCFTVHLLKFEILQTTSKNKTKTPKC